MQTCCPHCETNFRLTESQIDIANGYVRCGICDEVFNVYEVADNTTHENNQQDLLNNTDNTPKDIDTDPSDSEAIAPEAKSDDIHQTPSYNEAFKSEETNIDDFLDRSDDFFNEESNESLHHVVPDDLRSYKPPSVTVTALWSVGTLLLISSFSLEYIWFNQDEFYRFPGIQTKIEQLCQKLMCDKKLQRDPDQIELITRNVYSHPNEKDALMINLVIKNTAEFAQPYPVMQIDFSDIRGTVVAARRFYPNDYTDITAQNDSATALLQPDTDTTVTLEISDPGKQAMTYEFNFL